MIIRIKLHELNTLTNKRFICQGAETSIITHSTNVHFKGNTMRNSAIKWIKWRNKLMYPDTHLSILHEQFCTNRNRFKTNQLVTIRSPFSYKRGFSNLACYRFGEWRFVFPKLLITRPWRPTARNLVSCCPATTITTTTVYL